MAIASSNGAQLFIGPVNTTADSKTAYAALSWTEITSVESIGDFGDQSATITFTSLGDSRTHKRKGSRDAGDVTITCGHDPLDAGQQAATAAAATDFTYAFKVMVQDGADANDTDSVFYFRALVSSARFTPGQVNNMLKRTYVLLIDSKVVEVLSVAVP